MPDGRHMSAPENYLHLLQTAIFRAQTTTSTVDTSNIAHNGIRIDPSWVAQSIFHQGNAPGIHQVTQQEFELIPAINSITARVNVLIDAHR